MLALSSVYNHYRTTYAQGAITKYDAHKKSELRDIYNSIIRLNKESPLYLPDTSKRSQAFAIGIKESARGLHNVIASLGGLSENELLNKKAAYSTNEDILTAQYVGDANREDEIPSFDVEVRSLASPQVNFGSFLPSDSMQLPTGTYSFDVNIHNTKYEFQYNITDGDTNLSIQEKLVRLIKGAGIGIDATVETDGNLSAIRLVSSNTGSPLGRPSLFTVSDTHSSMEPGSVGYFGIGQVTRPSSNAELIINGLEQSVPSNRFILDKTYELTLNGISPVEGQTATVSVKDDMASLQENIGRLVKEYNSFINYAFQSSGRRIKNTDLLKEMKGIASQYEEGFDHMGLRIEENGSLGSNQSSFVRSMEDGEAKQTISMMRGFADSLFHKTIQISLDPMQYVEKRIVAYKNPAKIHFATPYITSPYTGMLFNSYC
ncbi:MAG: hypothetical protein HFI94_02670 [Lachnospiraceae bacterium]|jgi:flagellar hook-associated protein 2|nr:hypothetical protein [Lachnospiraceae bacterium]